jgi:hypothetical protein
MYNRLAVNYGNRFHVSISGTVKIQTRSRMSFDKGYIGISYLPFYLVFVSIK